MHGRADVLPVDFELSRRGFDPAETAAFTPDLIAQGADASLLQVWSATVSGDSHLTRPLVLRALRSGRTVAAAVLMVCHDWGRSFFGRPLLRRAARLGPPIWYWERTGLGTDAMACPGVVAQGEDREAFVRAALGWLERRFLLGCVLTPGRVDRSPTTLGWPGLGISTLHAPWDVTALLAGHRNLGRKVRKFGHRDGSIARIHGRLPPELRAPLLATYDLERPLNPPYIELYPTMVDAHWALADDRLVHLVATARRPTGRVSLVLAHRRASDPAVRRSRPASGRDRSRVREPAARQHPPGRGSGLPHGGVRRDGQSRQGLAAGHRTQHDGVRQPLATAAVGHRRAVAPLRAGSGSDHLGDPTGVEPTGQSRSLIGSSLEPRPPMWSSTAGSTVTNRSTSSPPSQRHRATVIASVRRPITRHVPPASSQRRSRSRSVTAPRAR